MNLQEIKSGLAALMYYQSPDHEKGVSFESTPAEKQQPFLQLAESVLVNIDKMGLKVVSNAPIKDPERVEAVLRDHIESTVRSFFDSIKIWKKGAIPQEELVQRIFNMFKNL